MSCRFINKVCHSCCFHVAAFNEQLPPASLLDLLESVTNLGNELLLRTCSECLTVVRADKGKRSEHLFPENLWHGVFRQLGVEPNDAERKLG